MTWTKRRFLPFALLFLAVIQAWAQESPALKDFDDSTDNKWVAPQPVDENARNLNFLLQTNYEKDGASPGQAFSLLDISARKPLDENAVFAEALLRVQKSLSTSDDTTAFELRLARISYLQPWLQVTAGRFDVFEMISPDLFFGGYPLMGIHRVDGVMVTVPFSFFLGLGASKTGEAQASSPLAASFFYTPSLFSAQFVAQDLTQSFWLSQLRFRMEADDLQASFRVNLGQSGNDFFTYSSMNGNLTGSVAADLRYNSNYSLTAEYGVQNLQYINETGALALGFQASRIGTWKDFSIDQIGFEVQLPTGHSALDPFTGGNAFDPLLASSPQIAWYGKIRMRLKVLFMEIHLTNNQDDYTLDRLVPGSIAVPFSGSFGPGYETNGSQLPFRAASYHDLGLLAQIGVEF